MDRVYITAEAGINHNGQLNLAREMIEEAASVGVDCVKFQYIIAEEMAEEGSEYYDLFRRAELSDDELVELKKMAEDDMGLDFMMTATSPRTAELTKELNVDHVKIGSANIDNTLLLDIIGEDKENYNIYFSSGMSTLTDIERALNHLGYEDGDDQYHLYHCTSKYPADHDNLNLRALEVLQQQFPDLEIGYSDHTKDHVAAVSSVSLGATLLEKHFTLSHDLDGPDHEFSADINELEVYVRKVRKTCRALGDQQKRPAESERGNIGTVRRFLIADTTIEEGEPFSRSKLTTKRVSDPDEAINVPDVSILENLVSPRDYGKGDVLRWTDFNDQ